MACSQHPRPLSQHYTAQGPISPPVFVQRPRECTRNRTSVPIDTSRYSIWTRIKSINTHTIFLPGPSSVTPRCVRSCTAEIYLSDSTPFECTFIYSFSKETVTAVCLPATKKVGGYAPRPLFRSTRRGVGPEPSEILKKIDMLRLLCSSVYVHTPQGADS